MAKDTFYFSHDYNSRNDEKIKFLIRKHGMLGYGVFWAIIEDLYNNANALRTDCDGIAYDLRVHSEVVHSVLHEFGLFVFEGENFGSMSVQKRIDERDSKSKKASQNARKRWVSNVNDATAMPPHSDRNAIKERKGKEIKEIKEIIELPFVSKEFEKMWFDWKDYKKNQFKFTYRTTQSELSTLQELIKLSNGQEDIAIKIINQSMANGWKGLFNLKEDAKGTTNNQRKLDKHELENLKNYNFIYSTTYGAGDYDRIFGGEGSQSELYHI
jgi:hypothetical protein